MLIEFFHIALPINVLGQALHHESDTVNKEETKISMYSCHVHFDSVSAYPTRKTLPT